MEGVGRQAVLLQMLGVVGSVGGWFVVVAALHLGGCIGDWALMGIACRQPRGSRYEDLEAGLRIHLP